MSVMVDDLLTLSRIDAHQEPLAREPLDLVALARQTVDELGALAATGGVLLRADSAGDGRAVGDEGPRAPRAPQRRAQRRRALVVRARPSRSPCGAVLPALRWSSPTTARACRRRYSSTCSTGSTAATPRARERAAARASAWPSPAGRCAGWAVTSPSRARSVSAPASTLTLPVA